MNQITIQLLIILLVLAVLFLYNKKLNILKQTNDITANTIDINTNYNEEDIISHLDYIINEAIDEYLILHNTDGKDKYITSKDEDKIIEYLQETIPDRISKTLYKQLSYIYNEDYLGEFLGKKIYYRVVDLVVSNNIR